MTTPTTNATTITRTKIRLRARVGQSEVRLSCDAHPDNAAHVLEFCLDRIRERMGAAD
jgi:hypothetical protein